ncbi:hypothetical protein I6I07_15840 [Achromobacter deleyi]|uniref:Uncharacterized protein n=1 Tax=Achromobacter deleyi TaxID=1353891 RepID=A0A7T4E794_9BURK|nr:hypothetical protein [Achromobacter deleyi]QQB37956.1 hypothetical protein I6I07_15840 [Achromobacter deleyi]
MKFSVCRPGLHYRELIVSENNARIESGLLYEGESKTLAAELREAADDLSPRDTPELDEYDAGILGSAGGGDVDWWQDYLRAELERAHAFYQSQLESLL